MPNITGKLTVAGNVDTNYPTLLKTMMLPHMLLWMTHFPEIRNRNRYAFYNTDPCSRKTGIFVFVAREWCRQGTVRTLEAEERICKDVTMHRGTIARRNATVYHVIHSAVWRIIQDHHLYTNGSECKACVCTTALEEWSFVNYPSTNVSVILHYYHLCCSQADLLMMPARCFTIRGRWLMIIHRESFRRNKN